MVGSQADRNLAEEDSQAVHIAVGDSLAGVGSPVEDSLAEVVSLAEVGSQAGHIRADRKQEEDTVEGEAAAVSPRLQQLFLSAGGEARGC